MTPDAAPPHLDALSAQPARVPLCPDDLAATLPAVPALTGWHVVPGPTSPAGETTPPRLAVTYATGDGAAARSLANRIGEAAEAADHHPDLTVSSGRLAVRVHSHDVGALTSRDVRMARTIARLAHEALAPHALAVYGTLAPGRSNAHVMEGMIGTWSPATVRGVLHESGIGAATGYPGVVLEPSAAAGPSEEPLSPATVVVDVPAQLFVSADLPDHWARLDAFEGAGYRRMPVVATLIGEDPAVRPAWIYELVPEAVPLDRAPARAESDVSAQ